MNRKAFQTCAAAVVTALGLLMAGRAGAQSPPTAFPGDWPASGSYNGRQNQNSDPLLNNSGNTRLRWLTPSTTAERLALLLDNTSFVNTSGFVGGPYDPPATGTGFVNGPFPNAAAWPGPTDVTKEANEPYLMPRHSAAGTVNRLPRVPSYNYATCTPMARDQADPTVAQTPAQRKYFEWIFTPPAGPERNYALYAWLPIGPTDVSADGGLPDRRFAQRYFVYEIRYGFDRNGDGVGDGRFIDVVDTEQSGNGFVRLGNGGLATQNTFPFTGGQPIRVRLYNIVPRAANGVLQLPDAKLGDSDLTEATMSSNVLVYADAAQAQPQPGTILANPTAATISGSGATIDWNLTIARNVYTPGLLNGDGLQSVNGIITSYQANPLRWPLTALTTPLIKWRYSTVQESANGNTTDNNSADVTFTGGWTTSTVNGNHVGTNYRITPVVISPAAPTETATYAPNLDDGNYDLYAYVAGNVATQSYTRALRYQVFEGTRLAFTGVLDEANQKGWIRLGTRRYVQLRTTAQLKVVYYNVSTNTGDAGRVAFADAIRFVGAANLGVTSTPVHATVKITPQGGGTPVDKKVVIVADESGKIHCLDLIGNADGTTTEYWSYPSTPDPSNPNWADPNLVAGIDGTINSAIQPPSNNQPTAEMPTSFDLSSAAIARVDVGGGVTKDLLYIGATNGRVYCIDAAGRGDYIAASHKVGSTSRRWSYPDDYPTTAKPSDLGAFQGSIVYGDTAQGAAGPTVFVPSVQGRVIALNAIGTAADASGGGVTTVRWEYPLEVNPTLPPIEMTPTLQFNHLYFGTLRDPNDGGPGQLYSLRADTGVVEWRINGTSAGDLAGTTIVRTDTSLGSFIAGPVGVAGTTLAAVPSPYTTTNVDTLYILNQNLNLYGFAALTGAVVTNGTQSYVTSDLNQLSGGHLTYTVTKAYDRLGTKRLFPMIAIAGDDDGHFRLAFARLEDYNIFDGYFGDGLNFPAGIRSMAAANNFMFTADKNGSVYALDDLGSAGGNLPPIPPFDPGVTEVIPPNDPRGKPFRKLRIKLVTKAGYVLLRDSNADGTGKLTYDQAITQGLYDAPNPSAGNPFAFEWGQTAYILVYDFPYADKNEASPPADVPPPQINLTLSVEGKTVRNVQVDSRKFTGTSPAMDPADDPNNVGYRKDGYAIIPFSFQNAGVNTLPPGPGVISATISTAALGTSGQQVEIAQDTRSGSGSRVLFIMANPLALFIPFTPSFGGADQGIAYFGGALTNPYDAANAVNGSPDVAGTGAIESQLLASAGYGQHGGTQTSRVYVIDRSLMALLRQDGISNVRVTRTNLQRQGRGSLLSIYRRLDPGLYPGFEDFPDGYPNKSLDYPDMGREQLRAIKDPNGTAENPLLSTVSLKTPLSTVVANAPLTEDNLGPNNDRSPQLTPIDMVVDIPRYQPPVDLTDNTFSPPLGPDVAGDLIHRRRDSNGAQLPQGYFGRVWAFVDSTGDGKLNTDVNEANRAFNFSVGVLPQTSIQVGTPTVDLGSLAAGTGYAPANPSVTGIGGPFSPWNGVGKWSSIYKPISVKNDGNVNLLDLRMVKGFNEDDNRGNNPWPVNTAENDSLAWLSAGLLDGGHNVINGDLWSNIDTTFAAPNQKGPSSGNRVILPKPRVTDRVPSNLVANPYPRANPFLGTSGGNDTTTRLNSSPFLASAQPNVGVSIPIGFPVGSYSSQIRVVEDEYDTKFLAGGDRSPLPTYSDNQTLDFFKFSKGYEAYSDPITLTFKVRESRMTNSNTFGTAPIIDDNSLLPFSAPNKVAYRNAAPAAMRDAFGSLVVGWVSDNARGSGSPIPSLAANASRIYLASLRNGTDFSGGGSTNAPAGNSPLWDLNQFIPDSGSQWFRKAVPLDGYPAAGLDPTLFSGGTIVPGTTSYDSPSFPARSQVNPLASAPFNSGTRFGSTIMGFTGESQLSTSTGRITQSKVFASVVTTASNGTVSLGNPVSAGGDPQTAKGKPSVVQLSNTGGLFFYSETSGGQSGITTSRFEGGGFARPVPLNFGDGFSSVSSPSGSARVYQNTSAILELSFAGKLRGRPNAEVYIGRMNLATIGGALQIVDKPAPLGKSIEDPTAGNPFMLLPQQSNERLLNEGNGTYRARGVAWSRDALNIDLTQTVNGSVQSVLIPTSLKVERQSGLMVYDSRLGGKVYLDPELGTVRFVGGVPGPSADLRLTYQPAFLRVTPGGAAAYSSVNGLFDSRFVSNYDYWFKGSGIPVVPDDGARNDRFFFAYGRGAAGSGVTARPYSTTMRLGVRLPTRIATDTNGNIIGALTVTGPNLHPYQVDPANGRVYFMAEDENKAVTIQYTGVDEGTNQPVVQPAVSASVSFVLERAETPIIVDEAANDSSLTAFADPFTYISTSGARHERPPLFWLFYVSTRGGQPDIYFQTIAPRYSPFSN